MHPAEPKMLMNQKWNLAGALAAFLLGSSLSQSAVPAPLAWWTMDEPKDGMVSDRAGGIGDQITGGFTEVANAKKVTLKSRATGRTRIVDVRAIARGRARDIVLADDDVINIPESWF